MSMAYKCDSCGELQSGWPGHLRYTLLTQSLSLELELSRVANEMGVRDPLQLCPPCLVQTITRLVDAWKAAVVITVKLNGGEKA